MKGISTVEHWDVINQYSRVAGHELPIQPSTWMLFISTVEYLDLRYQYCIVPVRYQSVQ